MIPQRTVLSCLFFILLMQYLVLYADAQKIFSEGNIYYDVYLNNNKQPDGVYIISVKAGNIRSELSMKNGFSNISIYLLKQAKTYFLNESDEFKYALEMTQEEMQQKNSRFDGAKFQQMGTKKKIAGYECEKSEVTYSNGEKVTIYFTNQLITNTEQLNAMFPGLQGIALEYQLNTPNGMSMYFVANKVDVNVIDTKIFQLPPDYKIVSREELEKLKQ